MVAPDFVLAIFEVSGDPAKALGGTEKLMVKLLSLQEADERMGKPGSEGINDLHSVAAYGLARKHLN